MMTLQILTFVLQVATLGLTVTVIVLQRKVLRTMATNAEALASLTTQVASVKGTVESTKLFIAGLEQQLRDNANDPAAIVALADELAASNATLAAAIDNDPST